MVERSDTSHHDHNHDDGHDHSHEDMSLGPHAEDALISARRLTFRRNDRTILDLVDIDVRTREIVTLVGPNGAGKTTLVRILLGLEAADAGEIIRQPNLVVGYVPQRFDLDTAIPLTVSRFLALGKAASETELDRVLREVGANAIQDRQFAQLSGGELQRVLIARALLRDPQLLVLDEPVRGVDFSGEADLYSLIGRIRAERGVGVLLISHDLHVVMAQSDKVVCLNRHVCCSGVPQAVARHPEYARLFGPHAAAEFALYQHTHDHSHDLTGAPRQTGFETQPNSQRNRSSS
jgi:zinc transport system ATP-binding protein